MIFTEGREEHEEEGNGGGLNGRARCPYRAAEEKEPRINANKREWGRKKNLPQKTQEFTKKKTKNGEWRAELLEWSRGALAPEL